jgi:hypothetical protein
MTWSRISPEAWKRCHDVMRPALLLAPTTFLQDVQTRLDASGVRTAIALGQTSGVYNWIVRMLARQGIANAAAEGFVRRAGSPTWLDVSERLAKSSSCPRLRSYWSFADCGYRRAAGTCNTPRHINGCPVTAIPARKGALAQAAIGLRLFIRDVADNDLIRWIDQRLALADPAQGRVGRTAFMRRSLLEPLSQIPGTGPKIWSMVLAELLLGADPGRPRWVEAGASFVAVDSLTHNYLARSGILRHLQADHQYGAGCYQPGGCADVIGALAERIDAREFNADFPQVFPRWLQYSCWSFAAVGERNICNGLQIDDAQGCAQSNCPAFTVCERLPLHLSRSAPRAGG